MVFLLLRRLRLLLIQRRVDVIHFFVRLWRRSELHVGTLVVLPLRLLLLLLLLLQLLLHLRLRRSIAALATGCLRCACTGRRLERTVTIARGLLNITLLLGSTLRRHVLWLRALGPAEFAAPSRLVRYSTRKRGSPSVSW